MTLSHSPSFSLTNPHRLAMGGTAPQALWAINAQKVRLRSGMLLKRRDGSLEIQVLIFLSSTKVVIPTHVCKFTKERLHLNPKLIVQTADYILCIFATQIAKPPLRQMLFLLSLHGDMSAEATGALGGCISSPF